MTVAGFPGREVSKEIVESGTGMCAYGRLLNQHEGTFTDEDLDSFGEEAAEAVVATIHWELPDFLRVQGLRGE